MKFLVTGGAGFIGSHLCEYLIRQGHSVSIIDDLSSGSTSNLSAIWGHPRLAFNCGSLFDFPIAELADESDVIVHLAAAVGVKMVVAQTLRTIDSNVAGTKIVLEAAARRAKKVVIASSSEVYGKTTKIPFEEDDDIVIGPSRRSRWAYACSKALDEFMALAYWRERGVPVVIARLFNTVGPRQIGRYGMVLPRFVAQAIRNEPMTVFGDGAQKRCFGYVNDVVRTISRLCVEPAAVGEVFNLGGQEEVSINELANLVRDVCGSRSIITHVPYSEAYGLDFEDTMRRVPSLAKAQRVVGYQVTVTLRQIVELMVADARPRVSAR